MSIEYAKREAIPVLTNYSPLKFTTMTKEQQLEHRLAMIMDDLSQIKRFIFANELEHKFSEPTPMADEVWNHISNIEIACDLNTKESLRWTLFTEPNRLTDEV